jgi:hypothetical protein
MEINYISNADENTYKISQQQFLPLSEAEIQGLLHPAEANLGYFLARFQSLQLPSVQSESPLVLIPLLLNPMCLLKYVINCAQNFLYLIFRSGLTVNGLPRVYSMPVFPRKCANSEEGIS